MRVKTVFKIVLDIIAVIGLLVLLAGGICFFILSTRTGLNWSLHWALDHYVTAQVKTVGAVKGRLSSSIELDDITLKNLKNLAPFTLRIERMVLKPHGIDYNDAELQIYNARLFMQFSDTVILNGAYKDRQLHFNLFSTGVSLADICRLASIKTLNMTGTIQNINLYFLGTLTKPQAKGSVLIEQFTKDKYELTHSPVNVDLQLSKKNAMTQLNGPINIDQGTLKAKNTKISLNKSAVFFNGDPQNPTLAIDAYAIIEDVTINIVVNGTLKKPDLKLTSDPSYNATILAAMLATGKKVPGLESLEKGQLSPELASELAGYLFFSGSNDGFLSKLGITNVHVIAQNGAEGVGLTKAVTSNLSLGYGVEESNQPQDQGALSQQLEADYRIASRFYFGVEKQIGLSSSENSSPAENDFDFTLKYKSTF